MASEHMSFRLTVTLGHRVDVHDRDAIFESAVPFKSKIEALRHVPVLFEDSLFSKTKTTIAVGEITYSADERELGSVLAYFGGRAIPIGTYEIRGIQTHRHA